MIKTVFLHLVESCSFGVAIMKGVENETSFGQES